MNRRQFLCTTGAFAGWSGGVACQARAEAYTVDRALVLVDLNGGNDGLNTVIPIGDPLYRALRPTLAVPHDQVLPLDERTGLHPSLGPLLGAWRGQELAIVQGVGHDAGNRSHFRSRQIWDTASDTHEYRDDTWLAHASLPAASFVASCTDAARSIAQHEAAVVRIALHGFDTHENQALRHAALLGQLAQGLMMLRARLIASDDWHRTLVMTNSDFGRSARENAVGGTDHGAAAAHFLMGGNVRGGLWGAAPRLNALDTGDGLPVSLDFRQLHATACAHLGVAPPSSVERFAPLPLLRV
ncbi:DUF1501 domain-containing protein [Caballeronia sp. LZ034LL]|uniref:DUF1501 domain-containing protein n=1 Tax=Caballeronia sp. LZ034LL TaxID=3038567 RepID=UPI002857AFB0|nr:DUF1501 domain-containing protein [Caballeronia sp. LZ034LL]MDR5833828.1 DUF1501 domain-containing protein [Caballeronia sp. LZ034LL]